MALVDKLFSKLRDGAKTKSGTEHPAKGASADGAHGAAEASETEQHKLDLLDARIKTLEDRLREQGF